MSDMDPFGNIGDGWEPERGPDRQPDHCGWHDYYIVEHYLLIWPWKQVIARCQNCSYEDKLGWQWWWFRNIFRR